MYDVCCFVLVITHTHEREACDGGAGTFTHCLSSMLRLRQLVGTKPKTSSKDDVASVEPFDNTIRGDVDGDATGMVARGDNADKLVSCVFRVRGVPDRCLN